MAAEDERDEGVQPEDAAAGAAEAEATNAPAADGGEGEDKAPAPKAGKGEPKAKAAKARPAAGKAAKKAPARKAKAETDAPREGENVPEKQRRRKKPAETTPAAPGDATEAKEAAKAKPSGERRGRASAPARRRVVRARARYVRTSARKARMVCGHLRGKSVAEARAILAFTPRDVAGDWSKLLESAVANAESNHELLEDDLIVREAYADEGPTIKRFRPRAMGRATPIRKRTSHLTIALVSRPDNPQKRKG
jgi:ribosomal protein L22